MNKGDKHSEESRKKISNSLKGKRCCMRTEFARGHQPWNKGTKGLIKANKTSFKKGNIPANNMGGMKICRDGIYVLKETRGYKYTRNGKEHTTGKYESLARKKYREAFGDFDKSKIIRFKDGDVFNVNIENLELITRAEHLKRNQYKNKNICKICGKEFLARVKKRFTCSKECREKYNKILNKKWIERNKDKVRAYKNKWKADKMLLLNNQTLQ